MKYVTPKWIADDHEWYERIRADLAEHPMSDETHEKIAALLRPAAAKIRRNKITKDGGEETS